MRNHNEPDFGDWIERERLRTVGALDPERQAKWGQVFTASAVARTMAAMITPRHLDDWKVLDPGAGIGILAGHVVAELCSRDRKPRSIHVTAYEIDAELIESLQGLLIQASHWARARDVKVTFDVRRADFLNSMAESVAPPLIATNRASVEPYDVAILNPPYGKIGARSPERAFARILGADVPNVYAAFCVAALSVTRKGGDVIAITPRSFCNGTYFRDYRRFLLATGWIRQMHVFDARHRAFADDSVLQENVITHVKRCVQRSPVTMTAQEGPGSPMRSRLVPADRVVREDDPERFIHVVPDEATDVAAEFMAGMTDSVDRLGLAVSTGPVVDFRCPDLLRAEPTEATVPLLYPRHLRGGLVTWPTKNGNAGASSSILAADSAERRLLIPDGNYVLVKRFSAKEETRRVVAAWHAEGSLSTSVMGIENHVNYFHARGRSLDEAFAVGLTVYLNSRQVDDYFRQFSGHTQVNATDLRALSYPSASLLEAVGRAADRSALADPSQFERLTAAQVRRG